MKKIGYALMLAAMIAACSSDDNSVEGLKTEEGVLKTLKLKASETAVVVGGEVTFSLLDDAGKEVDGAVMINGKEISKKYVFDKVGVFKVVGSKQGFNASNEVTITVSEKELAPLTLKASVAEVEVGQKVTFEVMSKEAAVKEGVKIFDVKANKELAGMEFVATAVGEFEFIAKGEGFADSGKVTVKVKEAAKTLETKVTINGISHVLSSVNMELKMNKDDITKAKPIDMGNGVYGNEYSFTIVLNQNDKNNSGYIFLDFFVENPTIKVDATGKVTDYGKRVLPTKDSKIKWKAIWSSNDNYKVNNLGSSMKDVTAVFEKISYDKDPYRAGNYNGELAVGLKYKAGDVNFVLDLEFNGKSILRERSE